MTVDVYRIALFVQIEYLK